MRLIWGLALVVASLGCVERRLLVRTDPPEAEIYLDGRHRGRTDGAGPLVIPFLHYGTRTLVARRPGYAPVRRRVVLDPPWYQLPVLDLVTELLWPGTIRDERPLTLTLSPRGAPGDATAALRRAERFEVHEGSRP